MIVERSKQREGCEILALTNPSALGDTVVSLRMDPW